MQIILLKLITKEFSQKENKPLKINKNTFYNDIKDTKQSRISGDLENFVFLLFSALFYYI